MPLPIIAASFTVGTDSGYCLQNEAVREGTKMATLRCGLLFVYVIFSTIPSYLDICDAAKIKPDLNR